MASIIVNLFARASARHQIDDNGVHYRQFGRLAQHAPPNQRLGAKLAIMESIVVNLVRLGAKLTIMASIAVNLGTTKTTILRQVGDNGPLRSFWLPASFLFRNTVAAHT